MLSDSRPGVAAHRGGAKLAPENTLAAFRNAIELNPDTWLEMDVRYCADDVVVLHDPMLDKTTDCVEPVSDFTVKDLASCNAAHNWPGHPPEPVPTLHAVLEAAASGGWKLLIEIKNSPMDADFDPAGARIADRLLELIDQTQMPADRLAVMSFWPPSLDRIVAASIDTVLLTSSTLPGVQDSNRFLGVRNAAIARDRGFSAVGPDVASPDLNSEEVAAAHALGIAVAVWTVNRPEDVVRLSEVGVDMLIGDDPSMIYANLNP